MRLKGSGKVERSVFRPRQLGALLTIALAGGAWAQTYTVEPTLRLEETFTDNAGFGQEQDGKNAWITEIAPGISVRRSGRRVSGNLEASLRGLFYANDSSRNDAFLSLQGRGEVEAIDDTLFIDMNAAVGRNNTSSFGGRPQWDTLNSSSQSETRYLRITPRLVKRFGGGDLQASVRYSGEVLSYGSDNLRDQGQGTLSVNVSDPSVGRFGWSVDYSNGKGSYGSSGIGQTPRDASQESLRGTLTYHLTRQLALKGVVGRESNDFSARNDESGTITGYGFDWSPTPRTSITGLTESRFFGRSYDFKFAHRQRMTSWNLSYNRDVSSSFQAGSGSLASYYYDLFSASLQSQYPDPAERDQAVRAILRSMGIPIGTSLGSTQTNAYFVERRLQAGFSLTGVRNTLAFSVNRSLRDRLGDSLTASSEDDFANNNQIKTTSATVSVSHQLTPGSSLNGALYWSKSDGSGGSQNQSSDHSGLTLGATTKLGPHTSGALNYRHQTSDSTADSSENTLSASLFMSF